MRDLISQLREYFSAQERRAPAPPLLRERVLRAAVAPPRAGNLAPALIAVLLVLLIGTTLLVGRHFRLTPPQPARQAQPPRLLPPASIGAWPSGAFDAARRVLVIYQMEGGSPATWTWGRGTWARTSGIEPPRRSEPAIAYDAARGEVLLFGGMGNSGPLSDTWAWNGRWRHLRPASSPPGAAAPASMAYDPSSRSMVLYEEGHGAWSWNGSTWSHLQSAPPRLDGPALAFDGRRLILFGDGGGGGSQTWARDGSTWTSLATPVAPPPGVGYRLAEAPGQDGLVLFGDSFSAFPPATWSWDAGTSTWTLGHATPAPSDRAGAVMAFDGSGHRLLLFGGTGANDLWSWDGGAWTELGGVAPAPPTDLGRRMDAAAVAGYLSSQHLDMSPVLLPTWLPTGITQALVGAPTPSGKGATFDLRYYDQAQQRSFEITVLVPGSSNLAAANERIRFRGTVAYYQYFEGPPIRPLSIWWTEAGHWPGSDQLKTPGVPYVLAAYGLSEAEFMRAADSLAPLRR